MLDVASVRTILVFESVETESQKRHFSWLIASIFSLDTRMIVHVNTNANHVCDRQTVRLSPNKNTLQHSQVFDI